ncbi:hypothetical protein IQ264_29395 [Phormidium sp. LEGE 05292]|uniref:hypothetical protein n=1 Tax=[Phormidium] sp. LEGE 05292 TaxID=767427 RepID=UPI00187E35DA|nr:hypothetical protein [Phormidium sp. LEGE 05292]MBE9229524.1 hypothetical protein [Phormidium sp. LEGE 05292]
MNLINKLAGFLGVVGISSLLTLPGFAEVNLHKSANNSLLLAQNSPGQSTSNPINDRGSAGSTGVNAVDDPCLNGTNNNLGSSSSSSNSRNSSTTASRRNSSGSSSYPSGDDQSITAQNQRCLDQERNNSSNDSTTTPGMRNTPGSSTTVPGSTTSP